MGAAYYLLLALMAIAASASTLRPPVLPLIVRTPYLSTWLADARNPPWGSWPIFWTGEQVMTIFRDCPSLQECANAVSASSAFL